MHHQQLFLANCVFFFTILQAPAYMNVSIVGGREVKKPKPWLVSIQAQHHHVCGGTLIHNQWVLTAAHCKEFLKSDNSVTVLLGALSLKKSKKTLRIGVLSYKIPQTFSKETKANDMLLKLQERVQLKGTNVKVKPVPKSVQDIQVGTKCEVSGWGTTSLEVVEASDMLREVEVEVIDRELCNCYYNSKPVITEDMLCAGNKQKRGDACWDLKDLSVMSWCQIPQHTFGGLVKANPQLGDSGGPLECKKNIVGLVSGGNGCGDPKKPGVYTFLSKKHLFWINTILKNQSNSTDL